jgi:hypothetical protein
MLHKLSFMCPIKVSQDGPPLFGSGLVMHGENTANDVLVDVRSKCQIHLRRNSRAAPSRALAIRHGQV